MHDEMTAPLPADITDTIIDLALKVLTILSIIGAGLIVLFRIGRNYDKLEQTMAAQAAEISEIKEDIKVLNRILVDVALQKQRLDSQDDRLRILDARYDELRRGVGLITK